MLDSCISYYSYIKPQPCWDLENNVAVVYRTIPTSNHNCRLSRPLCLLLYIVLFLHQTTTEHKDCCMKARCISYYSYIKPQLCWYTFLSWYVVYRTIPTSNHNWARWVLLSWRLYIVLFLHQTTTFICFLYLCTVLYIVLFLHQTTTNWWFRWNSYCCISYYSYIKPQPKRSIRAWCLGCISYYSYIKPQPVGLKYLKILVVYRTIPTSNHNETVTLTPGQKLYIVLFLHQTTTAAL